MKKIVITYLFCLCTLIANAVNYSEQILAFYKTYIYNILTDNSNVELCKRTLTPTLLETIDSVSYATGADAIIRAQDAIPEMIESLSVEELGDDWYMVSYSGNTDYSTERIEIPIKMEHGLIRYIVPEWSGSMYGDSLLQSVEYPAVNTPSR